MNREQFLAEVPLTRGYAAIIDAADAELVAAYKWSASVRKTRVYAVAYAGGGRKAMKLVYMHRLLSGAVAGDEVDHRNSNSLDNRRANLRCVSRSQNNANQRPIRGGTSRFKGVCLCANKFKKWKAQIKNGACQFSATFYDEESAARWYDDMAIKLFGRFARINFGESQ